METTKKKGSFWNFVNNFEGDKIVLMIVLLLMVISILAISSSTPLLALQQNSTRTAIINEQFIIEAIGLGIIFLCYCIKKIGIFRMASQLGFAISFILLCILDFKIKNPILKPLNLNEATRALGFFGIQIHVYEVVKVAMIMYLAWAVNAYKNDSFTIANILSQNKRFAFLGKDIWKKIIYIYAPMLIVCVMIVGGSMSSAIFIGAIMVVTILIGGINVKELLPLLAVAAVLLVGCIGVNRISEGKYFSHISSALNRLSSEDPEKKLVDAKGTAEFQDILDKVRQPISAKIAISEGGIIGKGPGKSTQRYVVPVMFEDFMFSFIIEEYGVLGAILVMILYCSLAARGTLIVKSCENLFAKTAVAGLVILITGQAMMHMMINVGLGPLTGQTLPMISHGNSSFIMFSVAFGVILSISRMAKKKIENIAREMVSEEESTKDNVTASVNELDEMDF